jgi:hypothetical protein
MLDELHVRRLIDEHVTTLLNFPVNLFNGCIAGVLRSEQEIRAIRVQAVTMDAFEALDQLTKLSGELKVAAVVKE